MDVVIFLSGMAVGAAAMVLFLLLVYHANKQW